MKLMMVCPTCDGKGSVQHFSYYEYGGSNSTCKQCKGNKYIQVPQQILDDLECAEIERYLLKHGGRVDTYVLSDENVQVALVSEKWIVNDFVEKTKLEALRKAKEYLDGRGAE